MQTTSKTTSLGYTNYESSSDLISSDSTIKAKQDVKSKTKATPQKKASANAVVSPQNPRISKSKGMDAGPKATSANARVSIQNLQFPGINPNKPAVFHVRRPPGMLKPPEPKTTPRIKQRGYDFTSSTNSHFDNMLATIPINFRIKCSSISSGYRLKTEQYVTNLETVRESCSPDMEISQKLVDSHHGGSEKRMNLQGPEWRRPCKESFVAGAPRKFLGICPPNYEQISKMSKPRQKFFLTQDPRKVHCLVNPAVLRTKEFSKKKEFNTLTNMVKNAQNVCAAAQSESSEDFLCEVIDLENPLQLDFQGLDYTNTYYKDEQDLQNQRNYRRVCRYMERRRVKAETKINVEEDLHQETINVPKQFQVRDRSDPVISPPPKPPPKLGKLYRSADKPKNQKLINMEREERIKRYKDLYLRNKAREEQERKARELQEKLAKKNLPITLVDTNLEECIKKIDDALKRCTMTEKNLKKGKFDKRMFPNTLMETMSFKNALKRKNLVTRDKAKIMKEFFLERTGKIKEFPAADLEINSEISDKSDDYSNITERSTDDEDDMQIGKKGSKFKLRGFQFKLSSNLRGKFTQHEKLQGTRKEKTCITRDQWLKELAPKKQQIKLDVEMGIQNECSPDDPQLVLFPPPFGFKAPKSELSTIKEYVNKPLGRHYDRIRRKNLKFAKPRLRFKVKKFNLIRYSFGDTTKKFSQLEDPLTEEKILKLKSTSDFMAIKALKKKRLQEALRQKRLRLLGIPCKIVKKSRLQTKCENSSSSSDSDWVPPQQPIVEEEETQDRFNQTERVIRPLSMRCNMPAPKYREPTLRQHPRYPRDYDNQRVPSEMFDQIVLSTNLPFMQKLDKDKVKFANVELKKKPYTDKFEARHHHDHWVATQVQNVDVHYQPQLVKPETTKVKKKSDRQIMENFRQANPPCNQYVDMNLSLPQYDIQELIKDHEKQLSKVKVKDSVLEKSKDFCTQKDFKLQSRDPKELENLDYPGRQEYLKLLRDARELYDETKKDVEPGEQLHVDKAEMFKELEEDLQSIESCLTSLSSSVCTNLTNDSGSFLLMEGKEKVPLDFIRKSIVPFEELQRSRFQAAPIDVDKEQANPFQVLPFAGQGKAQLELAAPKDSFFTFTARIKNGLRLRLEVPVEDVREKLLGQGSNKHKGVVTTDIDENYVKELKNRPPVKLYKFKSGQTFVKDALRLKYESMLIQGQIVRNKIYDRLNEQHWNDMQRVKELFEKLFAKWEKQEYDAAMSVVYKVKKFYDETDSLKTEFKQLERDLAMLNMDIVFIEGHWIRCVMLQNFHYLLGDQEWRAQHDWMHRQVDDENELENFEDSIAKRSTLNIRKRDKDDAWAIKTFYEESYLKNKHDNLVVFENSESFVEGLEQLKTKTFIILLEMHFTLAIQSEMQYKLESFEDWCADDLREKQQYVSKKCAKLYFMDDRAKWLTQRTLRFLGQPFDRCFNDEMFHKDRAVIREAWSRIVPANLRSSNGYDLYTVDMVASIVDVVMDLLVKFEDIPMDLTRQVENRVRIYRAYLQKQSYQACHIEKRIDQEMKKVIKNLQPPYQKKKRTTKLPRYYLRKRVEPVKIKETVISERAKFFARAFNEDDGTAVTADIRDSIIQVGRVQEQIIPFYFDHFLKINGYTPNYNFKTQIELRDGPEYERMQVKTVIPEIQDRMENWEKIKRKVMEENIAQNPNMYVDVS